MINEIEEYNSIIDSITRDINKTQLQIMLNANTSLVELYYRIGRHISINYTWGNKFVEYLSFSLKESFPNMKGFSVRNLKYMKLFYEECQENVQFVHLGAQLPWKHNITLMEKVKDRVVREWYMQKCIKEGWTKQVLLYQIETNLYQRQVKNKKHNNFELTMKENSELANALMKDPYVFDIIELTSNFKEREL